jgi:hypothetical protein
LAFFARIDPAQSIAKPVCIKLYYGRERREIINALDESINHWLNIIVLSYYSHLQNEGTGKDEKECIQPGG